MKVVVDFDVCASTGTCTNVAKEIFEIRSDGYLYILNDYDSHLPDKLVEKANEAAELCPTGAISIEEDDDGDTSDAKDMSSKETPPKDAPARGTAPEDTSAKDASAKHTSAKDVSETDPPAKETPR